MKSLKFLAFWSLVVTGLLPSYLSAQAPPAQRIIAVGGTHYGATQTLASGTTVLFVLDSRPGRPGTVRVTGPSGWNGNRPWVFGLGAEVTWRWDVLLTARPVTGQYSIEVEFGDRSLRTTYSVDVSRTMPLATNIRVEKVTTSSVTGTWSAIAEAQSYMVAIAEKTDRPIQPRVAARVIPATSASFTFEQIALKSGQAYWFTVWAFSGNIVQQPTELPAQFNISVAASEPFSVP